VAPTRGRYSVLVSIELALALAVLVGAGLLLRASGNMRAVDFGIDYRSITTAHVYSRWRDTTSDAKRMAMFVGLEAGARRLPGVEAVAWRSGFILPFVTSARTGGGSRELVRPQTWTVSAEYLLTMGIRVTSGRDFMPGDAFAEGVAIVDDSAARALWGSEDPLGQRLSLGRLRASTRWLRVVGVAPHVRSYGASLDYFGGAGDPTIYVMEPVAPKMREMVVRSRPEDVLAVTFSLRRFLRDAVPTSAHFTVEPLRDQYDDVVTAQAFLANTFVALACMAVVIAGLGVYSVISYAVAQRRRDFAVRIALGATRGTIIRTVIHDATVMVLAGTGMGAFIAMWASQFVDSFLYDVYRIDAASLVVAELVLMAVALAAAVIPALRAARSNPMEVIRAV
jgi:putative ABC transport system permease protein